MTIIKLAPNSKKGHENQTIDGVLPENFPIPDGWALIPESLGIPETLENYPFGDITVEDIDGIPTVTSWTPLPIPEPEEPPEPDTGDSLEERLAAIEAAIERGLSL